MTSPEYWKVSAQADYDRAMAKTGMERAQRLAKITMEYPEFAPAWSALAECHLRAQRTEEARGSARRAVALNPDLYSRLSAELKVHCRDLLPAPAAAEPPGMRLMRRPAAAQAAQAPQPAPSAQSAKAAESAAPAAPDYDVRQAATELNRARALQGNERMERIEALSREYPQHGPIWLALATHSMAARRVEEAIGAMDRAIALDPELGRWFTPEMAAEYRYRGRYRDRLAGVPIASAQQPEPPRPAPAANPHPAPAANPYPAPAANPYPAPAANPYPAPAANPYPAPAANPHLAVAARPQTVQAGGATRMMPHRPQPAAASPMPQSAPQYPQAHGQMQAPQSPHSPGHSMLPPMQTAAPNAPTMMIGVPVPPPAPVYMPPPVQPVPVQTALPVPQVQPMQPSPQFIQAAPRRISWRLVGALAVGIGAGVIAAMLAVVLSGSSGEVRAEKELPAATKSKASTGEPATGEEDVLFSKDDRRAGK